MNRRTRNVPEKSSPDEIFAMVASQRRALADDLATISDTKWTTPSLCAGWQIRDVVAHLVWPTETSLPKMLLQVAAKGFSFDKLSDETARGDQRSPDELILALRRNADSQFKPPGMGPEAPLTDVIVHSLDIRRPLALDREISDAPGQLALEFLLSPRATKGFVTKHLAQGLRLEATDLEWARGSGETVRGTAAVLMLALTGRNAALDELVGDGVNQFRRRCETSS